MSPQSLNYISYNLKDSLTGQWYSEDFYPTDHPNMWWFVEEYFDMLKDYTPEDNIPLCSFPDEKYIRHDDQWVRCVIFSRILLGIISR